MGLPARRVLAVAGCALLLSLLGCGTDDSEPDRAAPPPLTIENPKDASGSGPCTLLSDEQLSRLGSAAGSPFQGKLGPGCAWRGDGSPSDGSPTVTIMVAKKTGLQTLASDSDPATARVRIAGYPALETFTRQGKYCRYDLGNAPDQVLVATMTGGTPDSCQALQPILNDVVEGLPAYPAE